MKNTRTLRLRYSRALLALTAIMLVGTVWLKADIVSPILPAHADSTQSPAVAQVSLYGNSLDLLRDALLPSSPASWPSGLRVVDIDYCGSGANASEGRVIAIIAPVSSSDQKPPPILGRADCGASLDLIAHKAQKVLKSPWAVALPITLRWSPWRLESITGQGVAAVAVGQPSNAADAVVSVLVGKSLFAPISTANLPFGTNPDGTVHFDVKVAFDRDSLTLIAFPAGQVDLQTAVNATGIIANQDASELVPAVNAVAAFNLSWANEVAFTNFEYSFLLGQEPVKITKVRLSTATINTDTVLRINGVGSTSPRGDQYQLMMSAQGKDVRIQKIDVTPVSPSLSRNVTATILASVLTSQWRNDVLRPASAQTLPIQLGGRSLPVSSRVFGVGVKPGIATIQLGLALGESQ